MIEGWDLKFKSLCFSEVMLTYFILVFAGIKNLTLVIILVFSQLKWESDTIVIIFWNLLLKKYTSISSCV